MPDVAVIGAGPAGSVASILLARRGWRVTLLEQHRFPRDKVCGECLSALGIDVLTRAGLAEDVRALRPVHLRRSIFVTAGGHTVTLDMRREMWGIRRDVLDGHLLRAAQDAGVKVLQLHRCEAVEVGVRPAVAVRDLQTNVRFTLTPDYVIVADGKAAFGAHRPRTTGDFGLKAHFANIDASADAITLAAANGHYLGLAPVTDVLWNVALSVPQRRLRACGGSGDDILGIMQRENRCLAAMLGSATRVGDWLAAPLPRFGVADRWLPRVIPVGNAAAALEPIGGEGMGLGMRSAELAVETLDAAERMGTEPDVARLRRAFDKLWRTRRCASRVAAVVMSAPALADFAAQAASASESISRLSMELVGK